MLEPIESFIYNKNCAYGDYSNIVLFLEFYKSECGSIIFTKEKLLNMLRYFKIQSTYDVNEIENYGKYFREIYDKFKEIEQDRQKYFGNPTLKNAPNYIENPTYLIATYNRLKRTIQNRTQYIILKDAILCLSPTDVEHFVNILLREYSTQDINTIIHNIKNGK